MDAEVTKSTPQARPDRTLFAVLVAIGLLVVIAIVVVLVRGAAPQSFDASTPEGVVQRYAQAVIDHDGATASSYLSDDSKDCEYYGPSGADYGNVRLTLQSTDVNGDRATVHVSVATNYGGGPFSGSEYVRDDIFVLVESGDSWLIEQSPYEFVTCDLASGE